MIYEPIWGAIIAWYLFLAGLGGGAFATAVFVRYRHPDCKRLMRVGRLIAPIVVIIGLCLLMFDAAAGFAHPLRFALLLTNFGSVMTWGVVFLAVFVVVALIVLVLDLMKREVPMWLDCVGLVMGLCVAIYTGCLLGVCQGFPLWNSALLPILFLVSAVSTGMAAVLLVGVFYAPDEFNEVVVMKKFHFWLPVIEFVLVAALLFITAFNPSPAGWESVMSLVAGNWAVAFWLLFVIVGLGVKGGIEKANLFMMPALIIMAVAIAIYTLTMPGAVEGALYYLTPDFSKFSPELVIGALGQMFYSLSLAMGIMITYGSYMRKQDSLTSSVVRIGGFDLGVSFIAGLLIVSAAFVAMGSGDAVAAKAGPSLMFVTLPTVFVDMGGMATFIGFLFFLLVLFAALTSAISLVETLVSIVHDGLQCTRAKALGIVIAFVVIAGAIINAGYNGLSVIEPLGAGSSILDFADFISNSVLMPIVALLTCVFVGWIVKPKTIIDEVRISSKFSAAGAWTIMIKYIAPVLVIIILVAYVAAQFGFFSM